MPNLSRRPVGRCVKVQITEWSVEVGLTGPVGGSRAHLSARSSPARDIPQRVRTRRGRPTARQARTPHSNGGQRAIPACQELDGRSRHDGGEESKIHHVLPSANARWKHCFAMRTLAQDQGCQRRKRRQQWSPPNFERALPVGSTSPMVPNQYRIL